MSASALLPTPTETHPTTEAATAVIDGPLAIVPARVLFRRLAAPEPLITPQPPLAPHDLAPPTALHALATLTALPTPHAPATLAALSAPHALATPTTLPAPPDLTPPLDRTSPIALGAPDELTAGGELLAFVDAPDPDAIEEPVEVPVEPPPVPGRAELRRLLAVVLEVLDRRRPPHQLDDVLPIWAQTALLRAEPPATSVNGATRHLRSLHSAIVSAAAVEMCGTVDQGTRSRALVARMQPRQGRWQFTILTLL